MQFVLNQLGRAVPAGVAVCLLLVCGGVYWGQNYTTVSRAGDITLAVEADLAMAHEDGVQAHATPANEAAARESRRSVATKIVTKRRAGLGLVNRGHSTVYEATFPEFPSISSFLRDVNRILGTSHSSDMAEFTTVDWSLVWDELRTPTWSNREWSGIVTTDVLCATDKAVSLLEHRSEYTGGAHPNPWFVSRNFIDDHGKARELKLAELFDPSSGWADQLTLYCSNDLRRQGASYLAPLDDTDPNAITRIVTLDADDFRTFGLSATALWIFFGPYHVGTYAEGNYSVKVPYEELERFLTADSPARLFRPSERGSR